MWPLQKVLNFGSLRALSRRFAKPLKLSVTSAFTWSLRPMSLLAEHDSEFFRYTTGRWLWGENEQLVERYRKFNVSELKTVAARTLGSQSCIAISKIGEGNFNKVFRLEMDDGSKVIARIPHPNAGPPRYTTTSEVATMEFVRSVLDIPVPKVLAWSATTDNPVGAEYIIMEEARGTQLTNVWENMDLDDKKTIIEDIIGIEKKLLSVSFSRYGSLYFIQDSFAGCEAADITTNTATSVKEDVRRKFVVGPVALREFWEKERSQMLLDRGPWKSAKDYVEAIARREISWISKYASSTIRAPGYLKLSEAQVSPQEHIQLLNKYLDSVSTLIPDNPDLTRPTIYHPDLHDGNIFIHEGRISSIIDWQSIWAAPLILQARAPRLIDYHGEIKLSLPENFEQLNQDEKDHTRDQVSRSIQMLIYEEKTAKTNPLLSEAFTQPFGKTLSQLVSFAGNSWDDDIIPLRECLIRLQRDWSKLGIKDPCPYHFTDDDIRKHRQDATGFNETQDFWDMLEGTVDRTGWTTNEDFEGAVDYFLQLREAGLETLVGKEQQEFELETRWVLDHRPR